MTKLPTPRLCRPAVAFLAIVVVTASAAGRASATCGDYVTVPGQPPTARSHDRAPHPAPGSPAVPCHGPQCSKAPVTPADPITPAGEDTVVRKISAPLGESPVPAQGLTVTVLHAPSLYSFLHSSLIYHPPRSR